MQEMADPARSLARARATWQQQGRSPKWIEQRMTGQETRNKLTDYWAGHDIKKGDEFAILTNIIHQEWSGVGVQAHKHLKGLKTENLRDHMSEAELIFTALAELSTRQIAESVAATGIVETRSLPGQAGASPKERGWNWKPKPDERWLPTKIICPHPHPPKTLRERSRNQSRVR
jgi:DNA-damage-inducible protein D